MGLAVVVALIGLVFSMISIKLMLIIENAQIIVVKGIAEKGSSSRKRIESLRGTKSKKIVAFAISSYKLAFLRVGATFFARISSIIFIAESMYPERVVERAALEVMRTVLISNRILVTVRNGRHTIKKKIRRRNHNKSEANRE